MVADCRYGSGKNSVPVIKISKKRIKEEEKRKTYQGTQDDLCLESIPILVSHNRHPERVGDDCCGPWVFKIKLQVIRARPKQLTWLC